MLETNEGSILKQEEPKHEAFLNHEQFQLSARPIGADPQSRDLDSGVQIKQGLFAVGTNATAKTVFLLDGEASSSTTFVLNLRSKEKLLSVVQDVNDSKIITSQSKNIRQIRNGAFSRYNISIVHEFEGSVGIVSSTLHVTTSYVRYSSSRIFYVSGIVAHVDRDNSSIALVSGMGSPGLSFPNPDSVTLQNSSVGQIPLAISYQPPGPDVFSNAPSLADIISTAEIDVKDSRPDAEVPLLSYNRTECGKVADVRKDANERFVFPDVRCGVGFHEASQKLVFNLNRQQSGNIVVSISIPALFIGDEIFETSINIFVGNPAVRKPVLLLDGDLRIILDRYGREEFSIQMYNTIRPAQPQNATAFYMTLPGMRYAEIDFNKSELLNPIQLITFVTVRAGEEDENVLNLLKGASLAANQSLSHQPSVDQSNRASSTRADDISTVVNLDQMVDKQEKRAQYKTAEDFKKTGDSRFSAALLEDTMLEKNNVDLGMTYRERLSRTIVQQPTMHITSGETEPSDVYVIIPPQDLPIRAVSSGEGTLKTEVASGRLAVVDAGKSMFPEKVRVQMCLNGYSISGFSEHKSNQIKEALLKEALAVNDGTDGEIRLTRLRNEESKLIAEYDVFVSSESEEIATALMEKGVGTRIAKDVYLEEHRIEIMSAMAMPFKETPGNLLGSNGNVAEAGNSVGVLVAAIAILSFIVAIPLFVLCFGVVVSRRHEQRERSSNDTEGGPIPPGENRPVPMPDPTINTPIARDNFGRGDATSKESFNMQKEFFQEGYFGDNKSPTQKPK